jgi:hypothetical protein
MKRPVKAATPTHDCNDKGIAALPQARSFLARQDARTLFSLVTQERGSTDQLRQLVRHESVLELILMCIDLTKTARARVAATAKRKRHPIVALIEQIARDHPNISARDLTRTLKGLVGGGVIYSVTETSLEPEDAAFRAIPLSAIKDHLSRAKKKIAKAS